MRKYTDSEPEFRQEIDIIEETDTNHADNLNKGIKQIFANTLANRKAIDEVNNPATQSAAGLMSAADKKKLDSVASGANAYTHPNSGVAAGTYRSVAVNAQGHVTGGSNPVLAVAQGGTGATTAAQVLANIGAAAASHTHSYAGSTSAGGTAIRALGDSDGAQINATYRKKAEGSVVRIQASAPADTTALWAY